MEMEMETEMELEMLTCHSHSQCCSPRSCSPLWILLPFCISNSTGTLDSCHWKGSPPDALSEFRHKRAALIIIRWNTDASLVPSRLHGGRLVFQASNLQWLISRASLWLMRLQGCDQVSLQLTDHVAQRNVNWSIEHSITRPLSSPTNEILEQLNSVYW